MISLFFVAFVAPKLTKNKKHQKSPEYNEQPHSALVSFRVLPVVLKVGDHTTGVYGSREPNWTWFRYIY